MPQEIFLQQLYMNSGLVWGQTAVMVSLFLAVIYRPERIHHPGMFRWACVLLVLSLVVPSVLSVALVWSGANPNPMRGPSPMGASGTILALISPVGPVLFGLSVLFGLFALLPGPAIENRWQPPKHPLE